MGIDSAWSVRQRIFTSRSAFVVRHHGDDEGAEAVEHVAVFAVAPVAQGSEAFYEAQFVKARHPVLGGVQVAEEHGMDLAGGEHPMPTDKTEDLPVPVGERRCHVHDQPVRDPPRPPTAMGTKRTHEERPK